MAEHEFLGEFLASLEHGPLGFRADHLHARACETVGYSGHERLFGAYYHHIDGILLHELFHGIEVHRVERDVVVGSPGVARSHEKLLGARTLQYLPCHGGFASA